MPLAAHPTHECKKSIMAVHDALYALGGKWKIPIVACLLTGPKKYSEILRIGFGISGKMLSRELKELEINLLIKRTVAATHPVTVVYELTEYGKSAQPIINVLAEWGAVHREHVLGQGSDYSLTGEEEAANVPVQQASA